MVFLGGPAGAIVEACALKVDFLFLAQDHFFNQSVGWGPGGRVRPDEMTTSVPRAPDRLPWVVGESQNGVPLCGN